MPPEVIDPPPPSGQVDEVADAGDDLVLHVGQAREPERVERVAEQVALAHRPGQLLELVVAARVDEPEQPAGVHVGLGLSARSSIAASTSSTLRPASSMWSPSSPRAVRRIARPCQERRGIVVAAVRWGAGRWGADR